MIKEGAEAAESLEIARPPKKAQRCGVMPPICGILHMPLIPSKPLKRHRLIAAKQNTPSKM